MRIGDILSLPVNPNGERDGFEFDLTRGELDKLLGREGGEDWKSQPEGGA